MAVFFAGPLIIIVLLIVLLSAALFVVPQQQAYIIERFGKFLKVQFAGIHIRIPFVDRIAMKTNMRVNQLNVQLETKTLDNVFVTIEQHQDRGAARLHARRLSGSLRAGHQGHAHRFRDEVITPFANPHPSIVKSLQARDFTIAMPEGMPEWPRPPRIPCDTSFPDPRSSFLGC